MSSISFNEGDHTETLTTVCGKIYTYRYILPEGKRTSEWASITENTIKNHLIDNFSIPEIIESMSRHVTDLSIKEGNHLR